MAWLQRHISAVRVPDVQYRVLHGEIALVVEVDRAEHGVELVLPRAARDRRYPVQLVSGEGLTTEDFGLIAGPAAEGAMSAISV